MVNQGDFARALTEFWADGPKSETPPGHWNVIANKVSDELSPNLKLGGAGPNLDRLQWDVKLYLALNGAVHDAAIASWGLKGHYDSVRPISMIRYMGGLGQSSDPSLPSYNKEGLPLVPDLVELVTKATTAPGQRHAALAGNEGKIAIRAWSGNPKDPKTQAGGVTWILAVNWVPYQLPTFVTPVVLGLHVGPQHVQSRGGRGAHRHDRQRVRARRARRVDDQAGRPQGRARTDPARHPAMGDLLRRGGHGRAVPPVRRDPHPGRRFHGPHAGLRVRQGRLGEGPAVLRREDRPVNQVGRT